MAQEIANVIKRKDKKETFEWIQSWCDYAPNEDLPRVLLVGDSITVGYNGKVREMMKGKCYIDFVSTSYSIDSEIYRSLVKSFICDLHYDVLHFNHGLHGMHVPVEQYKAEVEKLINEIKEISSDTKIILALSTAVYVGGKNEIRNEITDKSIERNNAIKEIAAQNGYGVDDLFEPSITMPYENRCSDGYHFQEAGSKLLADEVVKSIEKAL